MQSDILTKMRAGVLAKIPVTIRGYTIEFRPLTIFETAITIAGEVSAEIQKQPPSARNAIVEHAIFSVKLLALASTSAPGKGDFKITERELQDLTPDELHFLFKEYLAGQDRINPSLEKISTERFNELLEFAKKNPSQLIELSFWELTNLCWGLLDQPKS